VGLEGDLEAEVERVVPPGDPLDAEVAAGAEEAAAPEVGREGQDEVGLLRRAFQSTPALRKRSRLVAKNRAPPSQPLLAPGALPIPPT